MFRKKPQIKNLSPLRSSDRRKLADQAISEFHISVSPPKPPPEEQPESNTTAEHTLSSIRNSLFPENCSSARFTTYTGADNKLVSGTVYVGSHPGHEERILWLQWGQNTQRLYPTVYTLWTNPGLIPLLHTVGTVVNKLQTGADLMTPGLFGGPPWPAGATKNSIVAVARIEKPSVPVWVGVCEIDVSALGSVLGVKGKAVNGIHWAGDEIWSWSSGNGGGREAPESLPDWGEELSGRLKEAFVDNDECNDDEDGLEDGGVLLDQTVDDQHNEHTNKADEHDRGDQETHGEPTTQEVDDAFQQAFVYSLYDAKKNGSPPYYGLDLPGIQPSYMVTKMIQPYLRSQSPHYAIKKTSWKNTKKFIKHLDKQKIIKSKDRNGGETIILDIDFDDAQIKSFIPYKLPKPRADDSVGHHSTIANGVGLSSSNQTLTIQQLYRASTKLVPDLIPSKTDYYTRAQISDYIRTYIENSADVSVGVSSRRFIKLNPFIANNILGSNQSTSDTQILAKGEIARDALQKRVLDDDHLCMPFWVLLRSDQVWDLSDRSLPKPKSGSPPKVTITIEKRTGTKTITTVTGLETFNISPQTMGPELQKKCASSASVQQANGLKPGMMEVMVQGDQRDVVMKEVGKRGVKKEWFEVVDKTKKKGK